MTRIRRRPMPLDGDAGYIPGIVAAGRCGRHTWAEIGAFFNRSQHTVRVRYYQNRDAGAASEPCPLCAVGARPEAGPGHSFEVAGNYATASSTDSRIRTLEDLCAACGVDLTVWQVCYWKAGTWEGFAKNEDKDLRFTAGVIDGHARSAGVIIETLYRTEARFVRREPAPVRPAVQPIACPVTYARPAVPAPGDGVQRGLLLADPQFGFRRDLYTGRLTPFHCRLALDLALQLAAAVQPERIAWLGDILDLAAWSDKFVRSPDFYFTTQPAVLEAHWWLRQFREACPEARIDVFEGNHDFRMRTALALHLAEACELRPADQLDLPPSLSPERLLALHKLGIGWVGDYPAGEGWFGPLRLQHGEIARKPPGATARAVVEDSDVDTAFGHIHRNELVSRRARTRAGYRVVRSYCPGCLCRVDGTVPGSKPGDNWQQGIGLVEFTAERFSIHDLPVEDGGLVWDGRLFQARDRLADLRADVPGWAW